MLEQQISKQIMEAMKAKETVRLSALRNIKKYIIEAKTSGTAVDTLRVLQEFLPRQMTAEELAAAVREIIAEVGAESMKDMGKVMGVASKRLAGQADGKDISAKVKELLA